MRIIKIDRLFLQYIIFWRKPNVIMKLKNIFDRIRVRRKIILAICVVVALSLLAVLQLFALSRAFKLVRLVVDPASMKNERLNTNKKPGQKRRTPRKTLKELTPEEIFQDEKVIALCHAIKNKDMKAIEKHIKDGANVNTIGKYMGREITPLYWSQVYGEEVFECLLKNGADPDLLFCPFLSDQKFSYLSVMISFVPGPTRCTNFVKLLLKYGADPDLGGLPALIGATHFFDATYEVFILLIDAGADLNACYDNKFPEYPLVIASFDSENHKKLMYLLESGATYDTSTIQGGKLQRSLYQQSQEIDKLTPEQQIQF
jgi:ankyrin repeat protein